MTKTDFDLIVIGTGPSASTVAKKCREAGKTVAVIEARGFGGTCALRGCNPKKVYSNAADLIDRVRGAAEKYVEYDELRINWGKLLDFKREFTDPVAQESEDSFREQGIATFHGRASFTGRNSVEVSGNTLNADHIFVGVGARPRPLDVPGGERAILSDEFFELASIPKRVVFIGGGYISMEFACVVARLGSSVTVVQRAEQVLTEFDPDLVRQLVQYSANHGIDVRTSAAVSEIQDAGGSASVVRYENKAGEIESVTADLVVHGAGRIPNFEGLGLEAGGVEYGEHGIQVDEFMRSVSNPSVYAAGDCVDSGQPLLTPTANEEARIIVKNLLSANSKLPSHRPDYGVIPQVAFTVPPIATIGLSQSAAQESHEVEVRERDTSTWGSVRKSCQNCAGYKIIVDKKSDLILGAHLLGPGAEDTINLFALAMKHGLTATDIKSTLFAYPTFTSDVRRMI